MGSVGSANFCEAPIASTDTAYQALAGIDEAEPGAMRGFERGFHGGESYLPFRGGRRAKSGGWGVVVSADPTAAAVRRTLPVPGRDRECRHDEPGVGPGVADVRADVDLYVGCAHALAGNLRASVLAQSAADARNFVEHLLAERRLDRLLARRADLGQAHAVGGQQRRERMDQDFRHAERVGDQTGMLAAGAAEAVERVARHVVAALH